MSRVGWRPVAQLAPAVFPDTGRGLMTLAALSAGDLVVRIPRHLLFTRERVLQQAPELDMEWSSTAQLLAAFLLRCRRLGHHPDYLSTLPTEYSVGGLCTAEEALTLPGPVREAVSHARERLQEEYEKMSLLLDQQMSFRDFAWAWCAVNTRAVYYKEGGMALAPYLDLLNHSPGCSVQAGFNTESDCYEIRTGQAVARFDQVFINYGPHDNLKLMLEYGFVAADNGHACVEFEYAEVASLVADWGRHRAKKEVFLRQLQRHGGLFCDARGLGWNLRVALAVIDLPDAVLAPMRTVHDVGDVHNADVAPSAGLLIRRKMKQLECRDDHLVETSASYQAARALVADMRCLLERALSITTSESDSF